MLIRWYDLHGWCLENCFFPDLESNYCFVSKSSLTYNRCNNDAAQNKTHSNTFSQIISIGDYSSVIRRIIGKQYARYVGLHTRLQCSQVVVQVLLLYDMLLCLSLSKCLDDGDGRRNVRIFFYSKASLKRI